jgi:prepilin-type N-terminal cleavage/methylation domain-containing protein
MPGSTERGFTLIELLIVVVIIGILAAIAIPKFANTKEKSFVATMKSDLRNLAVAQEAYLYETGMYTGNLVALRVIPSRGVTITVNEATAAGWSATLTHAHLEATPPAMRCYMFVGGAAPIGPALTEGILVCS